LASAARRFGVDDARASKSDGKLHAYRVKFTLLSRASGKGHFNGKPYQSLSLSIEHDLIVLMVARRRVDGNEIEVKAGAAFEDDAMHALRHYRSGGAAQDEAEGGRLRWARCARAWLVDGDQHECRPVEQ
jgi:hypothetical protein